MNKKVKNILILFNSFILFYIGTIIILGLIYPTRDGPGIAGLFMVLSPYILIPLFIGAVFFFWNKPIVKKDIKALPFILIILTIIILYFFSFVAFYHQVAIPLAKVSGLKLVCKAIPSNYNSDNCLKWLGIHKGDLLICDKIIDDTLQYGCYSAVALKTNNILACNKLKLDNDKQFCIFSIARETNNAELCPQTGKYEKDCYKELK